MVRQPRLTKLPAEPTGQLATTPLLSGLEMHLQPVPALPPPRLSGIAVVARQDRTFSNTKFAAQLRHLELMQALKEERTRTLVPRGRAKANAEKLLASLCRGAEGEVSA